MEFIAERVASNAIKKCQQTVLKTVMSECQQWAANQAPFMTPPDIVLLLLLLVVFLM